jgi:hypothetical protein
MNDGTVFKQVPASLLHRVAPVGMGELVTDGKLVGYGSEV